MDRSQVVARRSRARVIPAASSGGIPNLNERSQACLAAALCDAFEKSAPVLSQALSDALQAQFERLIGRGVVSWLKRILLAGILMLAGYTYTKTGGLK